MKVLILFIVHELYIYFEMKEIKIRKIKIQMDECNFEVNQNKNLYNE